MAWSSDNGVDRTNEVALRRAQLVLRRVTIRGYAVLLCNQPLRPTQPPTLSGTGNEYQPRSSDSAPNRAQWPKEEIQAKHRPTLAKEYGTFYLLPDYHIQKYCSIA